MIKCFKLPVIQVSTEFDVFFPGTLLGKNRVVSRYKISIFTIVKIAKPARRITQKRDIHISMPSVNKFKREGEGGLLKIPGSKKRRIGDSKTGQTALPQKGGFVIKRRFL